MEWVVLIDGQTDLIRQVEAQAEKHNVEVTVIQDFIHVIEYLWKSAHALYPGKRKLKGEKSGLGDVRLRS
ncbi:MAG: hypothetical protein Q3M30_07935 [Candidatus Electrothrix sp. Rat3]|nr:hypothetical protein [Candidatus Electrothrix rattekaaiensis]